MELLICLIVLIIVYSIIYVILNLLVPKSIEESSLYAETMGIALTSSVISILIYDYPELLKEHKTIPMYILLSIFLLFTILSYYEKKKGSYINYKKYRMILFKNEIFEERKLHPIIEQVIELFNLIILNIIPAISIVALLNVFLKDSEKYNTINVIFDYKIILTLFGILIFLKFIKIKSKSNKEKS